MVEYFLDQKWVYIFFRCRSEYFLNQKWVYIFFRCRSELFLNQKLIYILLDANLHFFFQIKSWSTFSLDVDLSFFNIADFETKKGSWIVVFVMFVIFSTYSINLFYEWNPLFKKSFSFFYTYKNRSNFLFIYHKTDLIFYKSKPIFFSVLKK